MYLFGLVWESTSSITHCFQTALLVQGGSRRRLSWLGSSSSLAWPQNRALQPGLGRMTGVICCLMACEVSCSCFAAWKFGGFLLCRSFASTAPACSKIFVMPCPDSAINRPCNVKILLTVNRNASLCYQGHKGGNKPRSGTRPAVALQQRMGWSADCPCPCPAWPAPALQPWSPPSQAMWQLPGSQSPADPSQSHRHGTQLALVHLL